MKTKSGLRKQFLTDKTKEREGVWFELPEAANEDGSVPAFLIVRCDTFNIEHSTEIERLTAKYKGREMSKQESLDATRKAFIRCGVRNWRNIQDDNGTEISYSMDKAFELLEDDEMNDLYLKLLLAGNGADQFKKSNLEIEGKN